MDAYQNSPETGKNSFLKNALFFLLFVIMAQFAGIVGSFFTTGSVNTWYQDISRPPFTPPGWLFAPVWISLYLLMGISAYLVWKRRAEKKEVKTALMVFFIQLVLNSAWSILFFGLHWILIAFIEILLLWIAILFMILKFYPISRTAALIQIPYILWVSFAAVLNFSFAVLNSF
ncbi:MAG: TspO/MBR family protein [Candidatus Aminicenantes bacterium]